MRRLAPSTDARCCKGRCCTPDVRASAPCKLLRLYTAGCGLTLIAFSIYFWVLGVEWMERAFATSGVCGDQPSTGSGLYLFVNLNCDQSMELALSALLGGTFEIAMGLLIVATELHTPCVVSLFGFMTTPAPLRSMPRIVGFVNVSAGFAQLVFFCFEPLACCCMGQDALRDEYRERADIVRTVRSGRSKQEYELDRAEAANPQPSYPPVCPSQSATKPSAKSTDRPSEEENPFRGNQHLQPTHV
ncbi:MAG: hypothetical protein SGPRY_006398 [Prymnesium sp.]